MRRKFRSPDLGIRYSFALVDRAGRPPGARQFLNFLQGPAGIELLRSNGFLALEGRESDRPAASSATPPPHPRSSLNAWFQLPPWTPARTQAMHIASR